MKLNFQKNMLHKGIGLIMSGLLPFALTSCLGDDENDYSDWQKRNNAYVDSCVNDVTQGKPSFERISPKWAPQTFVLMKWHNDKTKTEEKLKPLDNSTVYVKYEVETIDGTMIDNSYSTTTYGDSIYRTRPCRNIPGFWTALTNMHIGDSVTCIIPWKAGYGSTGQGNILPYSTLIYHMKLVDIPAFEIPYEQ